MPRSIGSKPIRKYNYVFKSGIEEEAFDQLRRYAEKGKFVARYESEHLPYVIEGTYRPDFVIEFEDGTKIYIETKGYFDSDARRKMVAVKKANPDKDIRLVFAKNNFIFPNAKSRYSDWAEKVGFTYAMGKIPLEWLRVKEKEKASDSV